MNSRFTNRIAARILAGRAPAVVGLDPRVDALPVELAADAAPTERVLAFYREVLPRIAEHIAAVKPNIAFFEAFGSVGFAAYEATCELARGLDLPVIGDIKRGDIGSTAAAYAKAHFAMADALTLHPYMGRDSIDPFVREAASVGGGVFVLVRTSNPSAVEFQELRIGDRTLSEAVADAVERWSLEAGIDAHGYGPIGAVVGATYPEELAALRARMPHAWLLIPGVGTQGGAVADLAPAFDTRGLGALVNQSRGILQSFEPAAADWLDCIDAALRRFCTELSEVAARA